MRLIVLLMTVFEIKSAVEEGKQVFWSNSLYKVVKDDDSGEFRIVCAMNGSAIALTWSNGLTLNGDPNEFYIGE